MYKLGWKQKLKNNRAKSRQKRRKRKVIKAGLKWIRNKKGKDNKREFSNIRWQIMLPDI